LQERLKEDGSLYFSYPINSLKCEDMGVSATDRKKEIEKYYTEEARRASSIFPEGELIPHERPDFLLRLETGTLGIEVTQLCREEPRAEAGRLAKLSEKAKAFYTELPASEPIDVSFGFSRRATDLTLKQLAHSLAGLAHTRRKNTGVCPTRDLPDGYCYIAIHTPCSQLNPTGHWHSGRAFDTVLVTKQMIESRIEGKNLCLTDYRLAAFELWLLIVNDQFLGPGEVYADPNELAQWKFKFDFQKVLLFARTPDGGGKVFELQHY
jgi:hypothetical protein